MTGAFARARMNALNVLGPAWPNGTDHYKGHEKHWQLLPEQFARSEKPVVLRRTALRVQVSVPKGFAH